MIYIDDTNFKFSFIFLFKFKTLKFSILYENFVFGFIQSYIIIS